VRINCVRVPQQGQLLLLPTFKATASYFCECHVQLCSSYLSCDLIVIILFKYFFFLCYKSDILYFYSILAAVPSFLITDAVFIVSSSIFTLYLLAINTYFFYSSHSLLYCFYHYNLCSLYRFWDLQNQLPLNSLHVKNTSV
jgi:hypothetical protein